MQPILQRQLAENLASIRSQIEDAAKQAGRDSCEIKLVAVTKYATAAVAEQLLLLGQKHLGESRPQSLWNKASQLAKYDDVRWHMIGHLQRNKLEKTLPHVDMLHSVDSVRLLQAVEAWCGAVNQPLNVLLEVNISGEPSKHGFRPVELLELSPILQGLAQSRVVGLMGMSSLDSDSDLARREFASLRGLRDDLSRELGDAHELKHLSMGMSGDFREAILEGSTMVRIGSALFEGIPEAAYDGEPE